MTTGVIIDFLGEKKVPAGPTPQMSDSVVSLLVFQQKTTAQDCLTSVNPKMLFPQIFFTGTECSRGSYTAYVSQCRVFAIF
jgi:hypothetical protein